MAILMVRHTTPRVAPGTCYGQTDLDVAEGFDQEADTVLNELPDIQAIVSSPLQRCRKLAVRIAAHRGIDVRIDHRLMELNFGRWEGLAWSEVPRKELDSWSADFHNARPHDGESVGALKARVDAAIADIRATHTCTLVVTHAGVVRAALAQGEAAHAFQSQVAFGEIIELPTRQEEFR